MIQTEIMQRKVEAMIGRKRKLCYVIMPYGENNKIEKSFYDNVFCHLIVPPCERLLMQAIRVETSDG